MNRKWIVCMLLAWLSTYQVSSQNVEGILVKHYNAYNQTFWNEVQTIVAEGVWFQGTEKLSMEFFLKRPDKLAIKGKYNEEGYAEVLNSTSSWTIAPWLGSKALQKLRIEEQLVLRSLVTFGSPISQSADLEYMGAVIEDDIRSYWLKETIGDTIEMDYYIDREDYFLRKRNIRQVVADDTEPLSQTFDQFRKYGPVTLPLVTTIKSRSLDREYVFDEIYIGDGIPESVFQIPAQKRE